MSPRRRAASASVGEAQPVRRGRTGPMAAGLLLAVAALFMAQATLRLVCVELNRADYVPDQLELEHFREARAAGHDARIEARLLSTGEPIRTTRTGLVGLDRLRALARENRVAGTRIDVFYLPVEGFWSVVDRVSPFRIMPPDEFEGGVPTLVVVAVNALLAAGSILLIRRGVGPKAPAGGGGAS
jgi:hypothetical protein